MLAGVALAFAVQVKIIPIFLFVFFIVALLQKKAFRDSIIFMVSFIMVNIISFWLMGVSPLTFAQRVSYNAGVYWQSLPNLLHHAYQNINIVFNFGFILLFCFLVIYQIFSKQKLLLIYAYSLVLYLFFFTTAYWNWYALWVLTLIPLLQNARFKFLILLFSFTSLLAYPFYWLSLRYNYQNIFWPISIYLFVFILPLVVYFLSKNKKVTKRIAVLD